MGRWKTAAIATIGAVILNVSAVAQTGGQSGSGQGTGASEFSVPVAPSGLTVTAGRTESNGASRGRASSGGASQPGSSRAGNDAGATQNPESNQGSEPSKTPAVTRPDPATTSKTMGADPMTSGPATKPERVRATQEALKSKGHDPVPSTGSSVRRRRPR